MKGTDVDSFKKHERNNLLYEKPFKHLSVLSISRGEEYRRED